VWFDGVILRVTENIQGKVRLGHTAKSSRGLVEF
jgi:hypothetical protein